MNKEEAIVSVSAYLPDSFIIKIIKLCNLYPVNSWRLWEDSFGNGIKINNKNINYFYKPSNEKIIKDIYTKTHPLDILKKAKSCFISFGKKNNNDICILWIQGKDKILRCSWIENYIWQPNIPPLSHGIIILKKIVETLDVDSIVIDEKIKTKETSPITLNTSIATKWAPTTKLKKTISSINHKFYKMIFENYETK